MPSLRYFYIISFILFILATIGAAMFARSYIEDNIIKSIAIDGSKAFANSFSDNIWRRYKHVFEYLPCDKKCPKVEYINKLKKEFKHFKDVAEESSILEFELFNHNGIETLKPSKNFFKTHKDEHSKKSFIATLKDKKIVSDLILDYDIDGQPHNVVSSLIPIKPHYDSDNYSVLEVIYDITPFWIYPNEIQIVVVLLVIIGYGIAFILMIHMTNRAESMLAEQYEKNADMEIKRATAEKQSKEKSMFLANVSHELRTPLNAIIGFSEIIKDEVMGPLNNQQYKDYINDIYISGVHLLSLINDILDYSKAEAGKLTVDLADVDVTKIMKNSIRLVSPRANEANIRLIGDIPKKHYILHTDGKRLKQVLLNIFSNAVKFTPEEGTITLNAWHNLLENMLIIEIKDTGVGIAPKDISKVMATFGQVENKLSRKYEGTGLGLPLSKKLIELMGGRLDIKSELGQGTNILISLPYIEEKGTGDYDEMEALKGENIDIPDESIQSRTIDNTKNESITAQTENTQIQTKGIEPIEFEPERPEIILSGSKPAQETPAEPPIFATDDDKNKN